MSGFDLPPILGVDRSVPRPQGPWRSPEVSGGQQPFGLPELGPLEGIGEGAARPSPFDGVLADSIDEVRALKDDVKDKVRGLVMGEDVELHDVMIASSKSEVAFNLLLEVRNKMVEAWDKLSRSSV